MTWDSLCAYVLALVVAPLLTGIINRVKAMFAGRHGQPLLQAYFDLAKLLRKGAVYSGTTTWVFRTGPVAGLAAVLVALAFVPLGKVPALVSFNGDFLLVAYLFGVMRFVTVMAALDTGSSFEGMGASREVQFSALAEPAWFMGLVTVIYVSGEWSLSPALAGVSSGVWGPAGSAMVLVGLAWLGVFLTENSRIPVDDPNTHLELTMIHEVMVLDHGGPDFAFILYGAILKLWTLGAFLVSLVTPYRTGMVLLDLGYGLAGMLILAMVVGIIESIMARLRLVRVPHLLLTATAFALLALFLVMR
ncbi:MAG: hydrogenase [Lentisphaerae bacterium RIFOXYC12_FULL_60_16]|nr:MAG: hydrogenase [Lentisphaerae bacterium RIFOXYC12_FULL_60_16]OGV86248.1 MAG: hydrogenase [Lentisphaerae bacterium RIFOXYB12_FULL_60_10]